MGKNLKKKRELQGTQGGEKGQWGVAGRVLKCVIREKWGST